MLTVWLIRSFTIDLVEHVAARRAPERAARLSPTLRRHARRRQRHGSRHGAVSRPPSRADAQLVSCAGNGARARAFAAFGQRRRARPALRRRWPRCGTRFEPGAPPTLAKRRRSPRSPPISPRLTGEPPISSAAPLFPGMRSIVSPKPIFRLRGRRRRSLCCWSRMANWSTISPRPWRRTKTPRSASTAR